MTHRIDLHRSPGHRRIVFAGSLDPAALVELQALCRGRAGESVHLLLARGTRVRPALMDQLVQLQGITLEAEDGSLQSWIRSCSQVAP